MPSFEVFIHNCPFRREGSLWSFMAGYVVYQGVLSVRYFDGLRLLSM